MSLFRPLVAAALLGSALFTGAAGAVCAGTQNTATVCHGGGNAVVYEDCVYVASTTCTPVQVSAPACFYGSVGGRPTWQTVWC